MIRTARLSDTPSEASELVKSDRAQSVHIPQAHTHNDCRRTRSLESVC